MNVPNSGRPSRSAFFMTTDFGSISMLLHRDKTNRVAEARHHHLIERLRRMRHGASTAHTIVFCLAGRARLLALRERLGGVEDLPAKAHDAEIGRPQHFLGAVGDESLAVLNAGILLGHALDTGEG